MSDLIAVAYPDTQTAKTVRALKELGQKLAPGGAALTVPCPEDHRGQGAVGDRELRRDVMQTSVDDESEGRLREVLEARSVATAGASVQAR